jgi:hypothetical protein
MGGIERETEVETLGRLETITMYHNAPVDLEIRTIGNANVLPAKHPL